MKAVNYIELDWKLTLLLTPSLAILSWAGFRQILLVTPHNTQKKEEEKNEQSRGLHDDIRGMLPI